MQLARVERYGLPVSDVKGAIAAWRDAVALVRRARYSGMAALLYSLSERRVVREVEIYRPGIDTVELPALLRGVILRKIGWDSADAVVLVSRTWSPLTVVFLRVTPSSIDVSRSVTVDPLPGTRIHIASVCVTQYPAAFITIMRWMQEERETYRADLETGSVAGPVSIPGCACCIRLRGGPWDGYVVRCRGSHRADKWGGIVEFYRRPGDREPALEWFIPLRDYEQPDDFLECGTVIPLEWNGGSYAFLVASHGSVQANGRWVGTTRLTIWQVGERGATLADEEEFSGVDWWPRLACFDAASGELAVVLVGSASIARLWYSPRGNWRVSLGEPRYVLGAPPVQPSPVQPSPVYPSPVYPSPVYPSPPGAPAAPRLPAWAAPAAAGTAAAVLGALLFKRPLPAR
jgi:hypothetical protein